MMEENAVRIEGVSKNYKDVRALTDISFNVRSGEVFGLIGPDGAGKTSLFRILATVLLPDSGNAWIHDYHVVRNYREIRKTIGYMAGRFSLYHDLTVEENLKFYATVFGTSIEENYYLISDIYRHIEPFKKRRAGKLSGGMKQKLALSCALIHKPSILILDEPTTGVDAVSRKEFWEMLIRLKEKNITILVSTPYMDEAILCDRVALLLKSKVLSVNSPGQIISHFSHRLWSVRSGNMFQLLEDIRTLKTVRTVYLFGQQLHVTLTDPGYQQGQLEDYLINKGHKGLMIKQIQAGIEDCFMELMSNTSE